jgi:hypothetical protein
VAFGKRLVGKILYWLTSGLFFILVNFGAVTLISQSLTNYAYAIKNVRA